MDWYRKEPRLHILLLIPYVELLIILKSTMRHEPLSLFESG